MGGLGGGAPSDRGGRVVGNERAGCTPDASGGGVDVPLRAVGHSRRWRGFPRQQKFLLGDRLQAPPLDVLERLVEATCTPSWVLLVYPSTIDEYGEALEALGRRARAAGDGPAAGGPERGPGPGSWVVTTEEQRRRWDLPDLAASGRVRVEEEGQAFGLLRDEATRPEPPPPRAVGSAGSALDAVRELVAPGARLDQALEALADAGLPQPFAETLGRELRQALAPRAKAVEKALDWAGKVLALPWGKREPQRFDRAQVAQVLDRTHGGLARIKTRLVELLAASPQACGLLTLGRPAPGPGGEDRRAAGAARAPAAAADAGARCLPGRRAGDRQAVAGRGRRRGARPQARARAAGRGRRRTPGPRA